MRRSAVDIVVALLHVLAVVTLVTVETEKALFQERVLLVPKCECEADVLMAVANPPDTVLIPAVGTRTGLIVGKIVPNSPFLAVVLAHGRPCPFGKVGSP